MTPLKLLYGSPASHLFASVCSYPVLVLFSPLPHVLGPWFGGGLFDSTFCDVVHLHQFVVFLNRAWFVVGVVVAAVSAFIHVGFLTIIVCNRFSKCM